MQTTKATDMILFILVAKLCKVPSHGQKLSTLDSAGDVHCTRAIGHGYQRQQNTGTTFVNWITPRSDWPTNDGR